MNHAFPCGTLALDFVGTRRARRNVEPTEKLTSPGDLADWFAESGMVDRAPDVDEGELADAVALREAIYALVDARIHSAPLPREAVALVNRHAARQPTSVQLEHGHLARGGAVSQGLASLARETVEIVGGDDAALLRECARPECTQVYLDRSRGHRREWCAMRTCGNRVKASNFRARHQGATAAR
ncbi:CGNR zinc finger domain-containing protein [Humibacter ginsenosidimutans]|uniref:Zinc finger CGNR domain-containing protein n=1 Tax=Humibacter ginsenosidimutans TaxID=2599293 RepID=A0A5B8M6T6_9MICO|nr:ABATE domain-containing protein [Humibacter ginsenosidimutans]QDZ15425.1 hypothetical protein FPZ11_12255 [Humibacter ginsenosidimutans]